MNSFEAVSTAIDQFAMLWRIKSAQPEGVVNKTPDKELLTMEIKLHALGVNADSLKM